MKHKLQNSSSNNKKLSENEQEDTMFTQLSKHHGVNEIASNERIGHQKQLKIKYAKRTCLATIALFLMSLIHHLYGEIAVFGSSLRYIMSAIAILPVVLSIVSYYLYKKQEKPIYLWLLMGAGILFFFVIAIYEGLYAHVILDTLTILGTPLDIMSQYWIRAEYKTLMFEITGVAQFPIGLAIVYYIKKLFDETYNQASDFIKKRATLAIGWISILSILAARFTAVVTEFSINDNRALLDADTWTYAIGIPLAVIVLLLVSYSKNQAVRKTIFIITILSTLIFFVTQFGIVGDILKKLIFMNVLTLVVGIWTSLQTWQLVNENQK